MATGGAWGSAPSWATGLPGRLHDFVKTVLLQQLVSPDTTVCDLLCGRGTDTSKWAAAGIGSYIGLDLSASALEDAEEEWKTLGKPYSASFCQLDPFLGELESKLQEKGIPFDTVCCLGHLQDSFSSEDKVKQLLQNVVSLLKPGGFFFGITADASTLWSKYQKAVESALKSGALRYGTYPRVKTDLYTISFEDDRFNIFGTRYQLRFADDGLAPQSQILVHFPTLIRLAKEAGLEYIEIQNLDEFFEDYRSHFPEAFASNCSSYLDQKGKLMPQIRDVLSLYTTFNFRKADIYSPGRAPMHIDYEPVATAAPVLTSTDTVRHTEQKTELRAFSRRSHKASADGDSKKKPLFRKDSEVETPVIETKEARTCEQSQQPAESRDEQRDQQTELRQPDQTDNKDLQHIHQADINRDSQRAHQVDSRPQERELTETRESETCHHATETREMEKKDARSHMTESKDLQSFVRRHHGTEVKEVRSYERTRHQTEAREAGTHERPSKELRTYERAESRELRTYERGHRDSRKYARDDGGKKQSRERHDSQELEELRSTAGSLTVETATRASGGETMVFSSREEESLPRLSAERSNIYSGTKEETAVTDVSSSVSVYKDEEMVPGAERAEIADRQEAVPGSDRTDRYRYDAMSVDGVSIAEPSSVERTENEMVQTPMHEYKRRNRWSKPSYPPPPPIQQHHQHYPSPEEIRAEMEAAQRRLNVPSILGPGPTPLMIHAYRRDGSRNLSKERNFHR